MIDIHVPGQQQTMTIPLGIGYDDKLCGVKNAVSLFAKLTKSLINVRFVFKKHHNIGFLFDLPVFFLSRSMFCLFTKS